MSLEKLINAINSVSGGQDVLAITKAFDLQSEDRPGEQDQVLGVYTGTVDGRRVKMTHSWYDRCRTYVIEPDGNNVELEVDGKVVANGSYLDER